MSAKNPRVQVVLGRRLYSALSLLARRDGTSITMTARHLLLAALEMYEDLALATVAEERERTLDRSTGLTHNEVWRRRRA